MKKVIAYFIKYPVAANVFILTFAIFGTVGMFNMKSSFFPLVESRIITVELIYPGASPEEVEEGIILKIEDNLKGVSGIEKVTSLSSENMGRITIEIEQGYNINVVLEDVKNAINRINSFPVDMEPPVIYKNENINKVITFAVSSDNISLKSLKEIAYGIEDDIRSMDGISKVILHGFPEEEIEIAVDENTLRKYNLTFSDVANAVKKANIDITGGKIKTNTEEYLIRGRFKKYYGKELKSIIIKSDVKGKTIRVGDVADVYDRWSENPNRIEIDGKLSVEVEIQTTNSEDFLQAADKLKKYIKEFKEKNPNLSVVVVEDRSINLNERKDLLIKNGIIGMLLVLLFLSMFLNPRMAFWVALGLPISFWGMFILANIFGVTINVISLFGMIVVVGILVDDGIVIAENVYRHYENGSSAIKAAIEGTTEVMPSVFTAVITTMISFSTFFFIEGRMGDFFSEMGFIVISTLLISLIEAAIILPSHLAHSKALHGQKKQNRIVAFMDKIMYWMRDKTYAPVLRFALKNRLLAISIPVMMLLITFGAVIGGIIKTTFFPFIERDNILITLKMPAGTNEEITNAWIDKIQDAAWKVNEKYKAERPDSLDIITHIEKKIGPSTSDGSLNIILLSGEKRNIVSFEIANSIAKEAGPVIGAELLSYGGGSHFGKPVSVSFLGNNIEELTLAKNELKYELSKLSGLKDINDNDRQGIKEINIKLKDKAYMLGLSLADVLGQIRSGFFGKEVQRLQRGRDEVKVWVRYGEKDRKSIKNLSEMYISTPSRNKVPFSEIATYSIKRGIVSISHLNGKREIKVEADLVDEMGSATDMMDYVKNNILPGILAKYPTVRTSFEGQNREAQKTKKSAMKVVPIILFLIFAMIVFTFHSFSQSILLFLMVPFSFIGVAWGHWIHNNAICVLSILGIIALIGILVNDGLVFIDTYNRYLKKGMKVMDAAYEAGIERFRPIFLTSVTTVAGLAPLILEKSFQAQFLIPMAISVAYGITIATILTLLLLPVLLISVNKLQRVIIYVWEGKKLKPEEVEHAVKERNYEIDEL